MTAVAEALDRFASEIGPLRLPAAYCPYDPTAKQEWFLRQMALEAFFGGAAGPGKSWGLLMAGLQYVDVPGYHGLLLRPTLGEFEQPGGLIDVSHEWLGPTDAWWHGGKREWTFPSGASLRFGYLKNVQDLKQYKGPSYSFCGFDELTSFPEGLYRGMFRVLRQAKGRLDTVPLRMRAASNPGDVGHCVPYGDVLTPSGWRAIEDMRVGDPVYAVAASGELVESVVEQVHRYASEYVTVEARGLHMAVTPEHRVAKVGGTRASPNALFSLVPYSELPGQAIVLRSVEWGGEPLARVVAAPVTGLRRSRAKPQPGALTGVQYARLLGWFLTEGNLVDRDRAVALSQSKPESRERLRAFLEEDCGFNVSWSEDGATLYASAWWNHLRQYAPGLCREKAVPSSIKNADQPVLAAFLDAAMDGDGHWENRGVSGAFYSFSLALADDVAEIAVKLGYLVHCASRTRPEREGLEHRVDIKRVRSGGTEILTGHHSYNVSTVTKRRSSIEQHDAAPVYCIGLPEHHAFVIRQRGSVWVSGNSWVKTKFVDPKSRAPGVVYIPARIADNPFLDYEAYLQSLAHMSPIDRARLINGDWDVLEEGGKFHRDLFRIIDAADAPPPVRAVRYWDLAATEESPSSPDPDYTCGLRLELAANGAFTVRSIVHGRWADDRVERVVRATAEEDGRGVDVYVEQEPGASGKLVLGHYKRVVLQGYSCYAGLPRGDKEVRARPVAAAVANGLVSVVRGPNVTEFLDEAQIFPNGAHDDIVDALSGAHTKLTERPAGKMTTHVPRGRIDGSGSRRNIGLGLPGF